MKQLETMWTSQIDPKHVWEEYPRPLMKRDSYVNLNGLWEYVITDTKKIPEKYDGTILVPFSPESFLSGVERQLKPQEYLWYRRTLPQTVEKTEGKRWLLHFGAVDQYAAVYLNGKFLAGHLGGYLPFSVDITEKMTGQMDELIVMVRDYSDTCFYSRGKQKLKKGGMFYTAQSGIWQTVWMEQVPEHYICNLENTPLYDEGKLRIHVTSSYPEKKEPVEAVIYTEEMQPIRTAGYTGTDLEIAIPDMHSWSPEDPYLYQIEVCMGEDRVESYAAMRHISVEEDENGIPRMCLNHRPYFQKGVLDQGYWPDGLYTPPCDEAMIYDIRKMKELGFNMLRKHVKIEPQRWYYHCDRLGMLVWQDMVNGGQSYRHWYVTYLTTAMEFFHIKRKDSTLRLLGRREEESRIQFLEEMKQTIRHLYNHPSIVTWVLFNEGWGQFYAQEVTREAEREDHTRLIDQASGWFDQGGGDIHSIHDYFFPLKIVPEKRVAALTEFGGYSLGLPGHRMYEKIYGYRTFGTIEELTEGYRKLIEQEILPNVKNGLSATVYTQLSDVEEEVNGILTYDRRILKMKEEVVVQLNKRLL